MKTIRVMAILVTALFLAGCTSYRAFEKAREYELTEEWDKAVEQYSRALEVDPGNKKFIIALQNAKIESSRVHFEKGKAYKIAGQVDLAVLEFELAATLDPSNQFAMVELAKAAEEARLLAAGRHGLTIAERKEIARRQGKAQPPQLDPTSDEPISLNFPTPTPIKEIYRSLGNAFGINVIFDQQVKDDPISIELRDVIAQAALERVLQAGGHFYKVLDEKTIIIVPDNQTARREYEDLVIQTFYLSNGNAEMVTNVVRTMLEARNVFPLPALNAITIRDTADRVRIAEQIIAANDKAKAEVVVSVELLQIDVTKARDIGARLAGLSGAAVAVNAAGEAIGGTIDNIRNLTGDNLAFTIPTVVYGFVKSNTDAQVLAKPQLRISEGETATLHIGRKIPLPVSTFTSANPTQGGTFAPVTSYTYQDVGIKISLEPRVHHNREVTLKLKVEVSDIAGFAPDTEPPQPIIGTRNIESIIRLKDGETNFLAGLIREDDGTTVDATPFLGDLPLIGRLFKTEKGNFTRSDLVLTMTPHIMRIADITDEDLAPMWVGTGANMTFRGVSPRIESQSNGDPFTAPAQFTTPPPPPDANAPGQPMVNVPTGGAPTDIFAPRTRPQPMPPTQTQPPPPPPNPNPQAFPPGHAKSSLDHGDSSASVVSASMRGTPRIAPQPMGLDISPGETRRWTLAGMDLTGLRTPFIRLHYNPQSFDVVSAVLGSALHSETILPPVITLDPGNGTITIRSSDGGPLLFTAGGDILSLEVRGLNPGESFLVLDGIDLRDPAGIPVSASIQGGRIAVR
ncbi:MAG TPA: secretin N-terminal domain-containing protein [Thermoanaerobaculia bacterium]|nr:secretin N-terminal domain-containing protein [Thermoanaerobaculia bacterium]